MNRFFTALATATCLSAALASATTTTVADAAMAGDMHAVRTLLTQGADVNAAQGDGVTALHWAALKGNNDLAAMLIVAGGNVRAKTRFGGYTPLHVASEYGHASVVRTLVQAGANVNDATTTGATPLMLAAGSGEAPALAALLDAGADINAREPERGHTALMFAAAANRLAAVKLLLERRADPNIATKVTDLAALSRGGDNPDGRNLPTNVQGRSGGPAPAAAARVRMPGVDRSYFINELVHAHGGMTPLHFAARQGYVALATALLDAGVDVNQVKGGDQSTPLLIAAINGQFDLAKVLLDRGANPNLAAENGVAPLYAVINLRWIQESGYPNPWAYKDQRLDYLGLMKLLLEKGADANARVTKKVWYSGYNFDQSDVEEVGSTAFWRAAYGADVEAMKLLVSFGADPHLTTTKPPTVQREGGAPPPADSSGLPPVPVGGPAISALHAASGTGYGEGFAGNSHRYAPGGMLAAVKYLVDDLHLDVNQPDADGNTALHNAAARGDNEMVLYLIGKGADVKAVNRKGQTTVDMANGPVQRTQPYPETMAILEKLGAVNNHKCVSC